LLRKLGIDSEEQKAEWRKYPEKYRQYRKMVESELSNRFKFILRNSKESDEARAVSCAPDYFVRDSAD
jgi:hypothetical protein